jgi:parallel beta-helix repeat protein
VVGNRFHDNTLPGEGDPAGIFVSNSDRVRFDDNLVEDNGTFGIHLNASSNENRLFGNTFRANPTNVRDDAGDNCGSENVPNEFPPC